MIQKKEKNHPIYTIGQEKLQELFKKRETQVPIRRGCSGSGPCFCTGDCQEIIGYRDKHPLEQ